MLRGRDLLDHLGAVLLPVGSFFSALSLASAALIAAGSIAWRRWGRGRRISVALMQRTLFPRRQFLNASTRADAGFFLLNNFATGAMIGWALLSYAAVTDWATHALSIAFGPAPAPCLPALEADLVITIALFLAYEFAYWLDHFLSHTVPVFWEFHRVHHTAERLTPLTVFRVHPVETLKFYNISVVVMACTNAAVGYALGRPGHGYLLNGTNVIMLVAIYLTLHLQHSEVWIAFTGRLGRIVASPAHHQLHHSSDPAHFGRNLGSGLALFDWMFGTLLVPTRERPPLVFGVEPGRTEPHTVTGGLVTPFVRLGALIGR
jgi:sterol desaturase/sphingolipid hydroxylase (fatty acid hydroxylase superfamily)